MMSDSLRDEASGNQDSEPQQAHETTIIRVRLQPTFEEAYHGSPSDPFHPRYWRDLQGPIPGAPENPWTQYLEETTSEVEEKITQQDADLS